LTQNALRTLLVVEDEGEIRELLAMMFEHEGCVVLKAADGEEALGLIREHQSDLVLLVTDLGLPKLGGIELIRQARIIIPTLKVIAASGFGHENVRSELRKVGVEEFFPKPFSPLELLETARRLMGGG
jgi:DNA-binding response OmpR family regulator